MNLIGREFRARGMRWTVEEKHNSSLGTLYLCRKTKLSGIRERFFEEDVIAGLLKEQ